MENKETWKQKAVEWDMPSILTAQTATAPIKITQPPGTDIEQFQKEVERIGATKKPLVVQYLDEVGLGDSYRKLKMILNHPVMKYLNPAVSIPLLSSMDELETMKKLDVPNVMQQLINIGNTATMLVPTGRALKEIEKAAPEIAQGIKEIPEMASKVEQNIRGGLKGMGKAVTPATELGEQAGMARIRKPLPEVKPVPSAIPLEVINDTKVSGGITGIFDNQTGKSYEYYGGWKVSGEKGLIQDKKLIKQLDKTLEEYRLSQAKGIEPAPTIGEIQRIRQAEPLPKAEKGITTPEVAGGKIPPQKPPAPPTTSPAGELPKPEPRPIINIKNLKVSPEAKTEIKKTIDEIKPLLVDKTLTHDEVLEKAKNGEILSRTLSREQTMDVEARLLNTNKKIAKGYEDFVNGKTRDISEAIRGLELRKDVLRSSARIVESAKIEALPEDVQSLNNVIKDLMDRGIETDKIIEASKGIDFKNAAQVEKFYRQFVSPTFRQVVDEFRYANMLSSPLTHIVNLSNNILQMAGLRPAVKLASGGIDKVASILPGRARNMYMREVIPYYKGIINNFGNAINNSLDVLAGKSAIFKPDIERIGTGLKIFKPFKVIPRALEAGDIFSQTLIRGGEKEALAYRMAKQGKKVGARELAQIEEQATATAKQYLFRDALDPTNKTGQGKMLSFIDKGTQVAYGIRKIPVVRQLIPFIQTPMNIFKRGIELTPLGIGTLPGAVNKTEQLGKMVVGSMVMAGGGWLALNDRLTYKTPTNPTLKKAFLASRQPFSINVGSAEKPYWVSYTKLGPLAYPLILPAAIKWYFSENPKAETETNLKKVSQVVAGFAEFLSEQSYVQGMSSLLKVLEGTPEALSRLATDIPRQYIPLSALLNWANNVIDPVFRQPDNKFSAESIVHQLVRGLPVLSKMIPPSKLPSEEPATKEYPFLRLFNPLTLKKGSPEWERYYQIVRNEQRATTLYSQLTDYIKTGQPDEAKKVFENNKDILKNLSYKGILRLKTSIVTELDNYIKRIDNNPDLSDEQKTVQKNKTEAIKIDISKKIISSMTKTPQILQPSWKDKAKGWEWKQKAREYAGRE